MKAIFSKNSNKKDIPPRMDRRTITGPIIPNGQTAHFSPGSNANGVRSINSFIPTVSSYQHTGHMNGHPGKQIPIAVQPQVIQTNGIPHPQNHFYSNVPLGGQRTQLQQSEHHYNTHYQQQQPSLHHNQPQINQRSLTKSYSSSQSHYGNTSLYSGANANRSNSAFYGNSSNLGNGAMLNGGVHNATNEKNILNGHNHNGQLQGPYGISTVHGEQMLMHQQQHPHPHSQQQPQHQQQLPDGQRLPILQGQRVTFQQQQNSNLVVVKPNATEGLPPPLVESMRTLFDILDDSKVGKIRLSEIETRWESDSNKGPNGKTTTSGAEPLIKMGVLEYLRKVTPTDGLLTFDRFCSGLRLALLTSNSNEPQHHSSTIPQQIEKTPRPPQTQFFQEQVRNMTNVGKPMAPSLQGFNGQQQLPPNGPTAPKSFQTNTINRSSKIPNLSSTRLPMPNGGVAPSGIPLSPSNKSNTIPLSTNKSNHPPSHIHNNTLISGTKRYPPGSSEQGTTVALVHPQPPPNPKPYTQTSYSTLGASKGNKVGGFLNRFSSKNSSMDDLQVPLQRDGKEGFILSHHLTTTTSDRPPSAPILDTDDNHEQSPKESQQLKQNNRERAKSQERDRPLQNGHLSRAEEKANFVKSRQRTLSMPQLQLNKLKSKSSVNFDESCNGGVRGGGSSDKLNDPPLVENSFPKPSVLKNNSGHPFSKLLASGHQYGGSSIPTINSVNNNTLKQPSAKPEESNSNVDKMKSSCESSSEQPPPPPKPPRNAPSMNGPMTISTTLVNGLIQEPPSSGSSFGSGQSSSNATTSALSASSGSAGGGGGKPEIRSVLNSWQKNMSDKKPIKASLSVNAILGGNESSTQIGAVEPAVNNNFSDDTKLRQGSKSSIKRKDTVRRHTVQSGIDFSTLKRLKQLEQEKDVLQQGLGYLGKASEWYLKQLETANEKINLLSKGAPTSDYWSESHEERLNLLGCRITEINNLLTALMDGSSQLPLHMNLQIPSHLSLRTITRLKDQNRQLTQEVSDYSHRVTQLENEKAMLLRQLFHQKNSTVNSDETVYM